MEKIRKLFRVDTNYQLIIVNIVFAITGTLALYLAGDVINLIGIKKAKFLVLFLDIEDNNHNTCIPGLAHRHRHNIR